VPSRRSRLRLVGQSWLKAVSPMALVTIDLLFTPSKFTQELFCPLLMRHV